MTERRDDILSRFVDLLERNDRAGAVAFALSLLDSGEKTVPELYETVLTPALNRLSVPRDKEDSLIWREHMQSNIVRSVVESCLPYVHKAREALAGQGEKGLVLLACPQEEYHELGVRMGADYFFMQGYRTVYVGTNTPKDTLINAVKETKPNIVVLSVTNYLNLAQIPGIVQELRALPGAPKIYLGGSALKHTGKTAKEFGVDGSANSYADVLSLKGGAL